MEKDNGWTVIDTTTPEDKLIIGIALSDAPLPEPLATLLLSEETKGVMKRMVTAHDLSELHALGEKIAALYQEESVKSFIDNLVYEQPELRLLQLACYRMSKSYKYATSYCGYAWDGLYGWMA